MFTADHIKELRLALGLKMADFAQLVGVTEGCVSYWESGKRHPTWKQLVKLNEIAAKKKVQLTA